METSSTSNTLVLLNPAANRGKIDHFRTLVHRRLEGEKLAEYVETASRGEAEARAASAAREGRPIIIIGGDGSVHEVANGILSSGMKVPLGIVAAGSGNDFAWNTLLLPQKPAEAIERAFSGRLVEADAGKVNGRYFVNSFSVGLDADIAVAAGNLKKFPFMSGVRLYYSSTLKQLLFGYHRCPWLTLKLDGGELMGGTEPRRYVLMAVTNGPTYGAGFRINPNAEYADGVFDVCTINHAPLLRALSLLPKVQKGEHAGLPEVTFYRARSVHIESQKPVNIQMDGETTCATRFEAEVLPGALLVRV